MTGPKLHGFILNLLKPFLEWASGQHLPFTHKLVTGKDYYKAWPKLKPGAIFLTKIRGDLTSYIIPGYWSHAAIYAPRTNATVDEMVMEAEGPGVLQTDLVSFMTSKDELVILEPLVSDAIKARAAEIATSQLGMPYDYAFDFHMSGQKAFYCSELVWWSYAQACLEAKVECPFEPEMELGVPTISPDNIYASLNFHVVYDSRKANK